MAQILQTIKNRFLPATLISIACVLNFAQNANAQYKLVIGSYRQGPGSKPHVSGITSPSLFAISTETLKQCQKAGEKISKEIYKPVWQFDNKWTCIYTGK